MKKIRRVKYLNGIETGIDDENSEGSVWNSGSTDYVCLNGSNFALLTRSSIVDLSSYIREKRCILNMQNKDGKCFLYSMLAF